MRIFGYCPRPLVEMMKFSINERYNRNIGKILNNQQLHFPSQVRNRKSLNFVFLFPQSCKNGHSLFYLWGLHLFYYTFFSYLCTNIYTYWLYFKKLYTLFFKQKQKWLNGNPSVLSRRYDRIGTPREG